MKSAFSIVVFFLFAKMNSQVYWPVTMQFHLAKIKGADDLSDFRFGYIPTGKSIRQTLAFDKTDKLFVFHASATEADAYIVIEKKGNLMVIYVDRSWSKVMRIKFRPGYFRVVKNKLTEDRMPKPDIDLTEEFKVEVFSGK